MGILCVTVDLDEIRCYHNIHGLKSPVEKDSANAVYRRAMPRIADFMQDLGIRGTFFAVGDDLIENPEAGEVLRKLALAGHEIANHSMSHPYELTLMGEQEQSEEISRCADVIERFTGMRPRGFRAPGYNVHLGLLDKVSDQGYTYDSSVFPCPAYLAAKTVAIGAKGLLGLESRSIIGDPRVLKAPTRPYRLGREGIWTTGNGLCELPISVVTPARLPFIGTSLTMMGMTAATLLARAARRMGFVNLELHGIDFLDAKGDGLGYLAKHQPDLKISMKKKIAILHKVVKVMLDSGAQAMTLLEAAGKVFI
jgi:hypothetical protein